MNNNYETIHIDIEWIYLADSQVMSLIEDYSKLDMLVKTLKTALCLFSFAPRRLLLSSRLRRSLPVGWTLGRNTVSR